MPGLFSELFEGGSEIIVDPDRQCVRHALDCTRFVYSVHVELLVARYKYRLRVNPTQAAALQPVFDANRVAWNMALERWTDLWRYEHLSFSSVDAMSELTDWRGRFEWLAEAPCTPQQQTISDLYLSIAAFFDKKNPAGRPKFKKKGTHATARWTGKEFKVCGTGLGRMGDRLKVGVGCRQRVALRVVWSRPLPSTPKSVTVYRDAAGRWWASFVVRIPAETSPMDRTTGVDVGLNTLATTTDPVFDVPNRRFAKRDRRRLRKADRQLSRAQDGSANRAKKKQARARCYATVAARRNDYAHKTSRPIARAFDTIGVEDLRIKNMLANHCLARSISDAGWGDWVRALEWQARKAGHEVVRVNPYNTSQTCSECGSKAKTHLDLSVRVFECAVCGLVFDRDRNAARNLDPGRAKPVQASTAVSPEHPAGCSGSPSLRIPVLQGRE